MDEIQEKTPAASSVTMSQLVLPPNTNAMGTIFGGTLMSWVDIIATIVAARHSRKAVVTASMDSMHFLGPIPLGAFVYLHARVNFVSRTSMEIGVRIESEDPLSGTLEHKATAYTTFVALDENKRPTPVPPLIPQTQEDQRRYEAGKKRRALRRTSENSKKSPQEIFSAKMEVIQKLIDHQQKKLFHLAQERIPEITAEDILSGHDFPKLAQDVFFHYEDGYLAGLMAAQMNLRSHERPSN